MKYSVTEGKWGKRAVLHGPWSPKFVKEFQRKNIIDLELNYAKGWVKSDLSFLSELPWLKAFEIHHWTIDSIEPIHNLHHLKSITIYTYCKTKVDFSNFPDLEKCVLEWRPGVKGLAECTSLKYLFLNRYKRKDTSEFSKLNQLKTLRILNSPINDLHGLEPLTQLDYLELANCRVLDNLDGIEALSSLTKLDIETCRKLQNIDRVSNVSTLRYLSVSNCDDIASLSPLKDLKKLEEVFFIESTNIVDGDLSVLESLPLLRRLAFQDRRHYTHRREEFEAYRKVMDSHCLLSESE